MIAVWLLCLAPIALLPGLNDRWGWPTLLCVVAAVLAAIWGPAAGRLPRWVVVLIAVILVVLVLAALRGDAPLPQLLGRASRYEGLIELTALVGAAWAAARMLGPSAPPAVPRHAAHAMALASVLLAVVAVAETFGLRPLESDLVRPGSLVGNATDQGIVGAVYATLLGIVVLGRWRRGELIGVWMPLGAVAGVVSVATSASRAGLLAMIVGLVVIVVRLVVGSPDRRRDALAAGGVVAVVAAAALAVPLTRSRLLGLSALAQQTIEDRFVMWRDAWELFSTSPWIGVGPNGFADAITPFFDDGWFVRAGVGAILDSPHNILVQAAVVGGIVGLLPSAALGVGLVVASVRRIRAATGARRDALVGGLTAVGAAALALLTHVTSPTVLVLLATIVGALVARPPRSGPPASQSRRWRVGGTVIVSAWLVALMVMTMADAALLAARAAAARGDLPAAEAGFEAAAALRPWDPDIALVAAESLGSAVQDGIAGAAEPAEEWAERAVSVLPESARAQYTAGMTATLSGDPAAAEERLRRAARLSPADPRIQHEYGVAAYVRGDLESARLALERAAGLDPEASATWAVLEKVCTAMDDGACADRARSRAAELAGQ